MIRGVEREGDRIRVLGIPDPEGHARDTGWLDWRDAEQLAVTLLNHVRAARDRELAAAGLDPGHAIEETGA